MWIRIRSRFAALVLAWSCASLAQEGPLRDDAPRADDPSDAMAPYRDRFKAGYEKFSAGALGEALQYWEPIYRELGPERGYRVAYNIALVYDALGDATRAAERYESFLFEVDARRARGEALEERAQRDEERARENLAQLVKSRARIRIPPRTPAETVRVDQAEPRLAGFVAYVSPGHHVIVFAPETKEEDRHEVDVAGGELVTVARAVPPVPAVDARRAPTRISRSERPYSLAWVIGASAAAIASSAIPVALYVNAQSKYDAILKQQAVDAKLPPSRQTPEDAQRAAIDDYDRARTAAYATIAVPITLGAGALALGLGYVFGVKQRVVLVPQAGGATLASPF